MALTFLLLAFGLGIAWEGKLSGIDSGKLAYLGLKILKDGFIPLLILKIIGCHLVYQFFQ